MKKGGHPKTLCKNQQAYSMHWLVHMSLNGPVELNKMAPGNKVQ